MLSRSIAFPPFQKQRGCPIPHEKIQLLALDIDGTLAARGDEVLPATRAALRRVASSGVEVVIATGRRYRTTRRVIDSLGFDVAAVVLGGALVKQADGSTLHFETFSPEHFDSLLGLARSSGQALVCQRDASRLGGPDFVIDAGVVWNQSTSRYFETHREFGARGDDFRDVQADALVFGAFGEEANLRALQARVEEVHPGRFLSALLPGGTNRDWYCDFVPEGVSKWSGLLAVARDRGIAPGAICAVGDQTNDLPMIREAGLSVAMGNGIESVKQAADWVTGACDEDGLVAVVDRILEGR